MSPQTFLAVPAEFFRKCVEILEKNTRMQAILIPGLSGVPNWVHVIFGAFTKHSSIPGVSFLHQIHSRIKKRKYQSFIFLFCFFWVVFGFSATRAGFLNSWPLFQTHTYMFEFGARDSSGILGL